MARQGFDNDQYLKLQSQHIRERIAQFGGKLYLEFGGKLFDDFHASRVLPGFEPDSKIRMLAQMKDSAEVIIAINAADIEKNKVRGDLGITYDSDVLRLIDAFRSMELYVGSVVVTQYSGQPAADAFQARLEQLGVRVYRHYPIAGYPHNIAHIVSDEGFGKNQYIETSRPLVVVTAPGPGSGKMATCLSQLYHEHKRGITAGYAKFETFPIWNLPLKHPVNLAYEAATADLDDVNMIDPFHLQAYGETTVNYNRDVEIFPVLKATFEKIYGPCPYQSPTDMGGNMVGNCICDDAVCCAASRMEILRRYYTACVERLRGKAGDEPVRKLELEMMAEELRLLYVAMTRAQEKLILSVALTEGARALERLAQEAAVPVPAAALERQQSVGAWVLLHALVRPEAEGLRALAGGPEEIAAGLGPAWDIHWVQGDELEAGAEERPGRFADLEPERGETEDLTAALTWTYPYEAAVSMPSKLTATQLKGRVLDQEAAQEGAELGSSREKRQPEGLSRPDFMVRERGLTAAQRGTALHLAMQYLPLEGDHSPETIREELRRLTAEGFLAAREVHREFKFSILMPAADYGPGLEGEEVLLQGVVDCWFDGLEGITVLDFKSDRIRPGGEAARGEEYRPQLEAYSRALERITGRRVAHRILWFFATGTGLEL